jgi:hypothetical protein
VWALGPSHASISTKLPATPESLKSEAPELDFAAASAASPAAAALVEVLVEVLLVELPDVLEELVALDDEALDELEELEVLEELDEPAVGWKFWLPRPKPMSDAKVPLTDTDFLSSLAVITSLPLLLSEAVTKALPLLIAPIRLATVLVPVEVNCVVLVPSLTSIVAFGGIPRVESGVLVLSGTVPTAVAGAGPEELEELDDVVPVPEAPSAFSSAAI